MLQYFPKRNLYFVLTTLISLNLFSLYFVTAMIKLPFDTNLIWNGENIKILLCKKIYTGDQSV